MMRPPKNLRVLDDQLSTLLPEDREALPRVKRWVMNLMRNKSADPSDVYVSACNCHCSGGSLHCHTMIAILDHLPDEQMIKIAKRPSEISLSDVIACYCQINPKSGPCEQAGLGENAQPEA